MTRLPRFMNRGLIEATCSDSPRHSMFVLPRFMNRGLIEAGLLGIDAPDVSALPRFMNRGLIEAPATTPARSEYSITSPIHESGPH